MSETTDKSTNRVGLILTTGFAMFAMFFGSGNLVFPIVVGMESAGHLFLASLGILLTGVLVPFLGAFAILLFKGESNDFFKTMGKSATFWFPLLALSLMGPFGVLPRCITVAHGSFFHLYQIPLWAFSLVFLFFIFLAAYKESRVLTLIGEYLTPVLIAAMAVIAGFGIWYGVFPSAEEGRGIKALTSGLSWGYQTMDLLAAFFFSSYVIYHLPSKLEQEGGSKAVLSVFLRSAMVGAFLLSAIYVSMVALGALYQSPLQNMAQEQLLGAIANIAIGPYGGYVVCVAVVLACFTTAVVLASLFSDFFRERICNNKISAHFSMLITLLISFLVSTLEFAGIAKVLGPILTTLYPAAIVLTVMAILNRLWGFKIYRSLVLLTFLTTLLLNFFE